MEIVKALEEKISYVVEKVKDLKAEKSMLQHKIVQLEDIIKSKDGELEQLNAEKVAVREQIEDLLKELDSMELR